MALVFWAARKDRMVYEGQGKLLLVMLEKWIFNTYGSPRYLYSKSTIKIAG